MKVKIVSLFSGMGGFEYGFKREGVDIDLIGYSENNDFSGNIASEVYSIIHNEPITKNLGIVQGISGKNIGQSIDILTHGSPCQSFSIVNQQDEVKGGEKGSGTKSSLMWETVRIVGEIKPKVVIWENVKAVLNKNNEITFNNYLDTLNNYGYNNYYEVLNGINFGIPQERERLFVISIRKDLDNKSFKISKFRKKSPYLIDYLDEVVQPHTILDKEQYYTWLNKKGPFGNRIKVINPIIDYANTLVTKQGIGAVTNTFVPVDIELVNTNYKHIYKMKGKQVLNELIKLDIQIRFLSMNERFRLMGYDDKILDDIEHLNISKSQLGKLTGNSIITTIPQSIMKDLIDYNIINTNVKESYNG